MSALDDRVDQLLGRIDKALSRASRSMDQITIVLATKTRTASDIRAAVTAFAARGITVAVAENRAQEMAKHEALSDLHKSGVTRHFIGHLQTNKARDIVRFADLIHSVDRDDAIAAVAKRASYDRVIQPIMLQVNTSGEASKGGFDANASRLQEALALCAETGALSVVGLMTIGAHTDDALEVRRSLRQLRELRDQLGVESVRELSMGMSNDLEIALEEGASYVRLGSAVFGPRNYSA